MMANVHHWENGMTNDHTLIKWTTAQHKEKLVTNKCKTSVNLRDVALSEKSQINSTLLCGSVYI